MRDQIIAGIRNAQCAEAPEGYDNRLAALGNREVEDLADAILCEFTAMDDTAPEPVLAPAPTMPVLMLSPADVIAAAARDALNETEIERLHLSQYLEEVMVAEHVDAGPNIREVREFIFAVQEAFGVRVRFPRGIHADGEAPATFIVTGSPICIRAFKNNLRMMQTLAADALDGLSPVERNLFWATLGSLCAQRAHADSIGPGSASDAHAAASEYMNAEFGTARTLRRTTPVTDGPLFEVAATVLGQADTTSRP
jgi:hypothetical protein